MWKLFGNTKIKFAITEKGRVVMIYAVLVAVGLALIIIASYNLFSGQREDSAARSEYDQLRDLFYADQAGEGAGSGVPGEDQAPGFFGFQMPGFLSTLLSLLNPFPIPTISEPELTVPDSLAMFFPRFEPSPTPDQAQSPPQETSAPSAAQYSYTYSPLTAQRLLEMNQDYKGWISIAGLVEYPVVQCADNDRYLDTTFSGYSNPSGAIFMDYRNETSFGAPICILYGHNMRNGSMFAALNWYLDASFMSSNPVVSITTPESVQLVYRIFAAKLIDMREDIYNLDFEVFAETADVSFGVPAEADRFIILSTCTNSTDGDERLIVCAALIEVRTG